MRIVFRAVASKRIGSGHVMRLLPLVDAFKSLNYEISLVFEISGLDWLETYLKDNNYAQFMASESDLESTTRNDVLILDSYDLMVSDPFIQQEKWGYVVAIVDDVSPRFNADLYIHPGLSSSNLGWAENKLIFGAQYIPIRKSLAEIAQNAVPPLKRVDHFAVIAGGGSDPNNFVGALSIFLQEHYPEIRFHVFGARSFPELSPQIHAHPIGPELDYWLSNATWAFLPASTLAFESLALKIPTAIAQSVSNQHENYKELSSLGWATAIGEWDSKYGWEFDKESIGAFLDLNATRGTNHRIVRDTIDFSGAQRIVNEIKIQIENGKSKLNV